MKRLWILVAFLSCLTWGTAQVRTGYVGFGVSYASYTGIVPNYPMPSLQVGGPLERGLELRGTLESLLIVSNIGLDVLYPIELTAADGWLYGGLGGNLRFFALYPSNFDLREVLGGEFPLAGETEPVNLFTEVRIYLRGLFAGFPTLEGRAGINFPF